MSGASTAAYLARRAAQKESVRILYPRAFKDTLNGAVSRNLFSQDASDLREKFEANKHVEDLDTIDKTIAAGEATNNKRRHPDPYIDMSFQDATCRKRATISSSRVPPDAPPPRKQSHDEASTSECPHALTPPPTTSGVDQPAREAEQGKKRRIIIRNCPMLNSEGRESLGSQRSNFAPHGGDYEPPRDKRLPRKPHRKNRRRLHIEEVMDARLILPKVVPPTLTRYSIGGGKIVDRDDFQTYPGVNDNNSIEDVELASRLAWSTILSRDDKEIFRSLPEGEDNSDYLVVKAAQQVVAMNAQHRTYRERTEKELQQLRTERIDLRNEVQQLCLLPSRVEELKKEIEGLRSQVIDLQCNLGAEKAKASCLEGYKEAYKKSMEDLRIAQSQCDEAFEELQSLRDQLREKEVDRDRIQAEAVREYRLSQDCFERKEVYSAAFVKYGFYLACAWLEEKRAGETFPELQFSNEVEYYEPPPWTQYEPDSERPEDYLEKGAEDDLSNLSGPWPPRQSCGQP